jgi:hypothetical protein
MPGAPTPSQAQWIDRKLVDLRERLKSAEKEFASTHMASPRFWPLHNEIAELSERVAKFTRAREKAIEQEDDARLNPPASPSRRAPAASTPKRMRESFPVKGLPKPVFSVDAYQRGDDAALNALHGQFIQYGIDQQNADLNDARVDAGLLMPMSLASVLIGSLTGKVWWLEACLAATTDRLAKLEARPRSVIDRGVFKDGTEYDKGDGVTWGGSFWIAQRDTQSKPDAGNGDWRLAVKKGRDGKDAKDARTAS